MVLHSVGVFCCCFEKLCRITSGMLALNIIHIWLFLLLLLFSLPTQDYCASKFGAVGFHESLSHELKAAEKDGIKTTLVCPYLVDTGMFRGCRIR